MNLQLHRTIPTVLAAAVFLILSPVSAQSPAPLTLPLLHLQGTGRICGGDLRILPSRLAWTSALHHCVSSYHVLSRDGKQWVIGLDQPKSCGFPIVEIKKTDPNFARSFWSIAGYANEQKRQQHPNQPELSCLMF
jgi:hypothetical protein